MNDYLPETEQWISLTKASEFLGVHSTTLRRWADDGQMPFMLTPGGHRRFALSDLQQFAANHRQGQMPGSFEQLWAEQALTQTRQAITAHKSEAWLAKYDDDMREQHRLLGRRLMGLTLQYISDPESNGKLLKQAEDVVACRQHAAGRAPPIEVAAALKEQAPVVITNQRRGVSE